jgi:regulator of RNase E activity RraB
MQPIPDDATGDALKVIAEKGSDLTKPMKIDFFVAVPSKETGDKVALKARDLGFTTSVEMDDVDLDDDGMLWTCYCTKVLVPEYDEVVKIEQQLDSIAKEFGGHIDGFGTFGNAEGE